MLHNRRGLARFSIPFAGACSVLAMTATLVGAPAFADTKAGVDAWQAGDYATAIKEWRAAAEAGDPDAAFNLGQAYKTGRGVPQDLNLALDWYGRASRGGHIQASDNYGLTLYQLGRKSEAMPYIQASSARGEPRAQYVYGAELFNGKLIEKDWPRAYAMMNRASAQGLAPASRVLAEMDQHIPLDQRQQGLALSAQLEKSEAQERTRQMSGYDMAGAPVSAPVSAPVRPAAAAPSSIESFALPPSQSVSAPVSAPAAPTAAGASYGYQPEYAALPEVKRVPADAIVQGDSTESDNDLEELPTAENYAVANPPKLPVYTPPPVQAQPQPQPRPQSPPIYQPAPQPMAQPMQQPMAQPQPRPASSGIAKGADGLPVGYVPSVGPRSASLVPSTPPRTSPPRSSVATPAPKPAVSAPAASPAAISAKGWRVQLGAYDTMQQAENSWYKLEKAHPVLAGMQPYLVKFNGVIRLQYGPFTSKAEADKNCSSVKRAGQDCFVLKQQ
jgi:uncharacterized protein